MSNDRPVALITGGARRVGLATARALAARGCDVHITFRTSKREAEQACRSIRDDFPVKAVAHLLDLNDLDSVTSFALQLAAQLSHLDVLVHNASVYSKTPLESVTAQIATRFMRINAIAPLLLTASLAERLRASRLPSGGAVICMSDIHALGLPRKDFAAYAMSKAALTELTRSLARDLAPDVRVNAVAPGVVAWPEDGFESDRQTQQAYLARVPLGRAGTPQEAAATIAWLALDASYITGQVIRLDGGRSLR